MEKCCPETCGPQGDGKAACQQPPTGQQHHSSYTETGMVAGCLRDWYGGWLSERLVWWLAVWGTGMVAGCLGELVMVAVCLRDWYGDWYGGQWKAFMHCLEEFVGAFMTAGIRLVYFFVWVVEEVKQAEWVKRQLRVNEEVARVFHHLKCHGQQPGRELFCLPPGLATFSRFALKSLGQETWCSVREAEYEINSFALRHNCRTSWGRTQTS
ncbi:unnamed protein product [Coregonus sp. 'balchen']|nr:unnamed protein product [Coregonus sp. 'balchen']